MGGSGTPKRRLGVVGSLVWDEIHGRDPSSESRPTQEWGGIAYALGALDASLRPDWEMVPLIKVGSDLRDQAAQLLRGMRRLAPGSRCVEVPAPNNRVTLRYVSRERRVERMAGGVPGWTWAELGPMVRDLDALYLNFISGFELELGTAQALRQGFRDPIYADLHSLLFALPQDGLRSLRPLAEPAAWFACFDVVQMNEEELAQFGSDPMAVAAQALAAGVRLLVVTLGPRGAVYFSAPGWQGLTGPVGPGTGPIQTALLPAPAIEVLDPTGCGDVFGGTLCAALLDGQPLQGALADANRKAARNASLRGASDLSRLLQGALATAGGAR
jgi:hypothetical protein